MSTVKKASVGFDFGFVKLGADFEETDRQCAWELYTELATRVAVTGKPNDEDCTDFSGEVLAESFASLYTFFGEARKIMRSFPVGQLGQLKTDDHLGALIHRAMRDVLRPFLETWQADFRHWWEMQDQDIPPMERQSTYPRLAEMKADWSEVRGVMRGIQDRLVGAYKLVNVAKLR